MQIPVRILLAEDDADDRIFFDNFLKGRTDLELMKPAENGSELLDMLDRFPENGLPHLIILDQNMPKLDGIGTLDLLKKNVRFSRIPVMIYSTYANKSLTENSIKSGALLVFSKPNDRAGYHRMIDDFLEAAESVHVKMQMR